LNQNEGKMEAKMEDYEKNRPAAQNVYLFKNSQFRAFDYWRRNSGK